VNDAVPLAFCHGGKGSIAVDASIEDHAVIGTIGLDIGFDGGFDCRAVGNIKFQQTHTDPKRADLRGSVIGSRLIAVVMQGDIEACCGQFEGNGFTYAAARTCD